MGISYISIPEANLPTDKSGKHLSLNNKSHFKPSLLPAIINTTNVKVRMVAVKQIPQISEAEYEVMKVVWKYEPISTPEVVEKVSSKIDWKPNTIQTMLARLVKKKALKAKRDGRVFIYHSLIEEYEYVEQKSKLFLNQFFGGTLNSMVLNFIENDQLSKDDISELRKILSERDTKEGEK
ncbi:BlaI/MecI/CopY family transcriptional regulator [Paracerasibacillus soli]